MSLQVLKYRKIPIISLGLIFVQKAVLLGLFSGELIFGGLIIGKHFAFQNGLGLGLGLLAGGLIIGRIFVSEILGGLFSRGRIIGILWYQLAYTDLRWVPVKRNCKLDASRTQITKKPFPSLQPCARTNPSENDTETNLR